MDPVGQWLRRFEIDEGEFELNRRGQLSPRQRERVRGATRSDWISMLVLAVLAWLVMGGVYAMIATSPHAELARELWLCALVFALPVTATIWAGYTAWIHTRDASVVDMHAGRVRKRVLRGRSIEICSIDVGDGWFDLARPLFDAVHEGSAARIYAVRTSRVVVMLEPLAG